MAEKPKSQIDKFKEAARAAETDDREETFDRALRRIAKPPDKKGNSNPNKPGR